jgi:hypothetical protein
MQKLASLASAVVGAGLMYALDPASSSRRRALARDQLVAAKRRLHDATVSTWCDARNRGQGLWASLRARVAPDQPTDEVLEQRIRSSIGRLLRFPRLVKVHAQGGTAILEGAVPADEVAALIRHVRAVRGVAEVENQLDVYERPEDLPGVQPPFPPRRPGPRFQLMRRNWAPSVRVLVGTLGVMLLLAATRHSPVAGSAIGLIGGLALLRAATNGPIQDRLARQPRDVEAPEESERRLRESGGGRSYQAPR